MCVNWQIRQSFSWKLGMRKPQYLAAAINRVTLVTAVPPVKNQVKPTGCKEKIFVLFSSTFVLTHEIVIQIVERSFIRPAVCTHQHIANR